ncbi:unnamed protein product [Owenia fusiformis]|uniref:Uncharacterized protein n=1 Tax=Owenia fusiformis TaxID=6347 RepID=A0A8J1T7L9_OWEFU|nr:unnamed protein product [Owenia fusiformis]
MEMENQEDKINENMQPISDAASQETTSAASVISIEPVDFVSNNPQIAPSQIMHVIVNRVEEEAGQVAAEGANNILITDIRVQDEASVAPEEGDNDVVLHSLDNAPMEAEVHKVEDENEKKTTAVEKPLKSKAKKRAVKQKATKQENVGEIKVTKSKRGRNVKAPSKYRDFDDGDEDFEPVVKKSRGRHKKPPPNSDLLAQAGDPTFVYTEGPNGQEKMKSPTEVKQEKSKRRTFDSDEYKKIFACPTCGKCFKSKGNLKTHFYVHSDVRPFACEEEGCKKAFKSKAMLKSHMNWHGGIKPFSCDICDKKFANKVTLKEHQTVHSGARPFSCNICDKTFRLKGVLLSHLVTHSSETPFSCSVCNKKFTRKVYLTSHQRSHTKEKKCSCPECGKMFGQLSDLRRHQIVHTGEKPYGCELCSARFTDPASKRKHLKGHTGLRPFVCEFCRTAFKRADHLRCHVKRKHNIILHSNANTAPAMNKADVTSEVNEDALKQQRKIVNQLKNLGKETVMIIKQNKEFLSSIANQQAQENSQPKSPVISQNFVSDQIQQVSEPQNPQIITSAQMAANAQIGTSQSFSSDLQQVNNVVYNTSKSAAEMMFETSNGVHGVESTPEEYEVVLMPQDDGSMGEIQLHINRSATNMNEGVTIPHNNGIESHQAVSNLLQEGMNSIQSSQPVAHPHPQIPITQGHHTSVNHTNTDLQPNQVVDPNWANVGITSNVTQTLENIQTTMAQSIIQENVQVKNVLGNDQVQNIQNRVPENDFISEPNFSSQEYFNWLTNFTEICRLVPLPLDADLFQKINTVHKTLFDAMAMPTGVLQNKHNFKTLNEIARNLQDIMNEHLNQIAKSFAE